MWAMAQAVARLCEVLGCDPHQVLVDGNLTPARAAAPSGAGRRGRSSAATRCEPCISAASILAKEHRDRLMREYARSAPALRLGQQRRLRHARAPRGAAPARADAAPPPQLRAGGAARAAAEVAPSGFALACDRPRSLGRSEPNAADSLGRRDTADRRLRGRNVLRRGRRVLPPPGQGTARTPARIASTSRRASPLQPLDSGDPQRPAAAERRPTAEPRIDVLLNNAGRHVPAARARAKASSCSSASTTSAVRADRAAAAQARRERDRASRAPPASRTSARHRGRSQCAALQAHGALFGQQARANMLARRRARTARLRAAGARRMTAVERGLIRVVATAPHWSRSAAVTATCRCSALSATQPALPRSMRATSSRRSFGASPKRSTRARRAGGARVTQATPGCAARRTAMRSFGHKR